MKLIIFTLSFFSFFISKAQQKDRMVLLNDSAEVLGQLANIQGMFKDKLLLFKYNCSKVYVISLSADTLKISLSDDTDNIMECVFNQNITYSYFGILDSVEFPKWKVKKMYFSEIVTIDSHCYASKTGKMCSDIGLNALLMTVDNPNGLDIFVQYIRGIPYRIIVRSDVFFYNPGYAIFFEMEIQKIKKFWSSAYEIHIKTLSADYSKNKESVFLLRKSTFSKNLKLKKLNDK